MISRIRNFIERRKDNRYILSLFYDGELFINYGSVKDMEN
jgi:hypothetical protein